MHYDFAVVQDGEPGEQMSGIDAVESLVEQHGQEKKWFTGMVTENESLMKVQRKSMRNKRRFIRFTHTLHCLCTHIPSLGPGSLPMPPNRTAGFKNVGAGKLRVKVPPHKASKAPVKGSILRQAQMDRYQAMTSMDATRKRLSEQEKEQFDKGIANSMPSKDEELSDFGALMFCH